MVSHVNCWVAFLLQTTIYGIHVSQLKFVEFKTFVV